MRYVAFIKERRLLLSACSTPRGASSPATSRAAGGDAGFDLPVYPLDTMLAGRRDWFNDPTSSDGARPAPSGHGFPPCHLPRGTAVRAVHHLRATTRTSAGCGRGASRRTRRRSTTMACSSRPSASCARAAQRGGVPDLPAQTRACPASSRGTRGDDGRRATWRRRGSASCYALRAPTVLAAFDECIAQTGTRARELFLELVPQGAWCFTNSSTATAGRARPYRSSHPRPRRGITSASTGRAPTTRPRADQLHDQSRAHCASPSRYLQSLVRARRQRGAAPNLDEWGTREGSI